MAIKRGSKVENSFSASSMTDLMFLLLIFMIIATTLISPNAVKLMLPKSANQLKDKAITTVSIKDEGAGRYKYFVELENVGSREGVERALKARLEKTEAIAIAVGSGVMNDTTKYVSHLISRKYMCVGTAASMSAVIAKESKLILLPASLP